MGEQRVPEIYINQAGEEPIATRALETLNDPAARARALDLREALGPRLAPPGATDTVVDIVARELSLEAQLVQGTA